MERACALREQGLLLREIAAAMGVALKTVHGWLSDPDGAKPRSGRATGFESLLTSDPETRPGHRRPRAVGRALALTILEAAPLREWLRPTRGG